MSLKNTRERWGWLAKVLHWTMAGLILALAIIGTYMANFMNDMIRQIELTQTHKSFGFVVFALAVLRVAWRWANPVSPTAPADQPAWERRAAHLTHVALYALMFAIPVSGWLMASASPLNDPDAYPAPLRNEVFGLFELPDPFQPGSEALTGVLHIVHYSSVYLLAVLLLIHIGGALRHHFVEKDDVLRRMLPWQEPVGSFLGDLGIVVVSTIILTVASQIALAWLFPFDPDSTAYYVRHGFGLAFGIAAGLRLGFGLAKAVR